MSNLYFKVFSDFILYALILVWAVFARYLSGRKSLLFHIIGSCPVSWPGETRRNHDLHRQRTVDAYRMPLFILHGLADSCHSDNGIALYDQFRQHSAEKHLLRVLRCLEMHAADALHSRLPQCCQLFYQHQSSAVRHPKHRYRLLQEYRYLPFVWSDSLYDQCH